MNRALIISLFLGYLALLFLVALLLERNEKLRKKIVHNPYVYSLTLAVYCSAWTFFGSVGMASDNVLEYATVYLGPTIMAPLFWVVLRKMIRISKIQNIISFTDFISSRYGKSLSLGRIAAICLALGIIPYIALQIKAIDLVFETIHFSGDSESSAGSSWLDSGFFFTLIIGIFIILFTTRKIIPQGKNDSLVGAVAFESVVKLIAFVAVGIFVFMQTGQTDSGSLSTWGEGASFQLNDNNSYAEWFGMIFLSGVAFLLLPRQFEMAVVENVSEKQINKAIWFVPLYLLIINFFVMPIAISGNHLLSGFKVDPDMYVLAIPLALDNSFIASIAVVGGFAAASGMVMVSTHALSKMLSNSVIMPYVINKPFIAKTFQNHSQQIPVFFRRVSIFLVLVLAFLYHQISTELFSLVSIGLVSFVAVAQFAPLMVGAMYWKLGNRNGAIAGLLAGYVIWFFHLVVPSVAVLDIYPESFVQWTILGGATSQTAAITQVLFWSLLANSLVYVFTSLLTQQTAVERNQAEIFVDVFRYSKIYESSVVWKGTAYFPDIKSLLERFLGAQQAETELAYFSKKHNIQWKANSKADGKLVTFAEKQLTSVIGSASAKIMVASVVKEERIGLKDVMNILKESQELLRFNKELTRKSSELKRATDALKRANQKLQANDELKDEFLYTVTHEMRTPLTSIRALSEILVDNGAELPVEMQTQYTTTILKESERMSRLISQVLDLENFESGKHKLQLDHLNMVELLEDCLTSMQPVFEKKGIKVSLDIQKTVPTVMGDYDRLTQVVLNLLSNAVKFVPEDNGSIKLTAYQVEHKIQVNVRDNGKGISKELQRVIFDKFFQARNQTIRKPKGSGLGLAISKKIVQLHEGQIWVDSEPGSGARFSFTIPLNTRF